MNNKYLKVSPFNQRQSIDLTSGMASEEIVTKLRASERKLHMKRRECEFNHREAREFRAEMKYS